MLESAHHISIEMSNPVNLVSRSPSKRRAISQPWNICQTGNQIINSVSKVFCFQVFPFYTNHLAQFCGSNLRSTLEEFLQLMDLLDFVGPGSRSRWHWHVCSPCGDAVPDIANIDFIFWTWKVRDVIYSSYTKNSKSWEKLWRYFKGKWLLSVCLFTADVSRCACFCFLGMMNLQLSVIF